MTRVAAADSSNLGLRLEPVTPDQDQATAEPKGARAVPVPAALSPGVQFLTERSSKRLMPSTQLANQLEDRVLQHPSSKALPQRAMADLRAILTTLQKGPEAERLYYLEKLDSMLDTPYARPSKQGPASELEHELHAAVDKSLKAYAARVARGTVESQREEKLSEGKHDWTRRTGAYGTTYLVDATRLDAIVVKVKVKLTFIHCEEMKKKIPLLEDAIEKAASARGYDVDLTFTRRSGPDVFEVDVDDRVWPNQANWADGADVLAHELCHELGLDDRYDLIEAHFDNRDMKLPERLYWFREQLRKGPDARGEHSKLGDHTKPLLAEDICAIVGDETDKCLEARIPFDPPGIPKHSSRSAHP